MCIDSGQIIFQKCAILSAELIGYEKYDSGQKLIERIENRFLSEEEYTDILIDMDDQETYIYCLEDYEKYDNQK